MNTQWLKEFIVLADTCSYAEAAERLFIGQSSLSKHIKALEEELGLSLFERSSRRVRLSREGELLLPQARALVEADFDLSQQARRCRELKQGKVTLAALPSMPNYGITELILGFMAEHEEYYVSVRECRTSEAERVLAEGSCELAFIRWAQDEPVPPELNAVGYMEQDELAAVLPAQHRLAPLKTVRLEQLKDESFACLEEESLVHSLMLSACERAGFAPRIAFTCREAASIAELIRRGLGVAILTRAQAGSEPGLAVRAISPGASTRIDLCFRKSSALSPAARAFIDYVNKNRGRT